MIEKFIDDINLTNKPSLFNTDIQTTSQRILINCYYAIHQIKMNIYFFICLFYRFCLNLLYRVTVLGVDKIPVQAPVIIYGNHNNSFADGMLFVTTNPRVVRVITARQAFRSPGTRNFCLAMKAISIERPGDVERKQGKGKVKRIAGNIIYGQQTQFTSLNKGTVLTLQKGQIYKIKEIMSDFEVIVNNYHDDQELNQRYGYKLKPNHEQTFGEVCSALKNNQCIGIFPQGLNQEVPQIQPIKKGICIMALQAYKRHGIKVKLQPCAFHSHKQHLFRSRVIIQFGKPHDIPENVINLYSVDPEAAINELMLIIQDKLKQRSFELDSFDQMSQLVLFRQLSTLGQNQTDQQKLELSRKLSRVYMYACKHQKYSQTLEKMRVFGKNTEQNGLSTSKQLFFEHKWSILIISILKCLILLIFVAPGLILWTPLSVLISYMVELERKYWKKLSVSPQNCYQLVGSYRLILGGALFPLNFIFQAILAYPALRLYQQQKYWFFFTIFLMIAEIVYALRFVKAIDRLKEQWRKINEVYLMITNSRHWNSYKRKRRALGKQISEMIYQIERRIGNLNKSNIE